MKGDCKLKVSDDVLTNKVVVKEVQLLSGGRCRWHYPPGRHLAVLTPSTQNCWWQPCRCQERGQVHSNTALLETPFYPGRVEKWRWCLKVKFCRLFCQVTCRIRHHHLPPPATLLLPSLPLPLLALLTQGRVVMVHGTGVKFDGWSSHCGSFACGKCTKISTNQFHEWMNQILHNFMFKDLRTSIRTNDKWQWYPSLMCRYISNDLVWKLN